MSALLDGDAGDLPRRRGTPRHVEDATSTTPWESKWNTLEADLQEAVNDLREAPTGGRRTSPLRSLQQVIRSGPGDVVGSSSKQKRDGEDGDSNTVSLLSVAAFIGRNDLSRFKPVPRSNARGSTCENDPMRDQADTVQITHLDDGGGGCSPRWSPRRLPPAPSVGDASRETSSPEAPQTSTDSGIQLRKTAEASHPPTSAMTESSCSSGSSSGSSSSASSTQRSRSPSRAATPPVPLTDLHTSPSQGTSEVLMPSSPEWAVAKHATVDCVVATVLGRSNSSDAFESFDDVRLPQASAKGQTPSNCADLDDGVGGEVRMVEEQHFEESEAQALPSEGYVSDDCGVQTADMANASESNLDGCQSFSAYKEQTLGNSLPSIQVVNYLWRLWVSLVSLSLVLLILQGAGTLADLFWSPCRQPLGSCFNIHTDDCKGDSCRALVPRWAFAWPSAGLLFLAIPLRSSTVLGGGHLGDLSASTRAQGTCCRRLFAASFAGALGVVGAGVAVLIELVPISGYYAARCPMKRASAHCSADICPSPACRRESNVSPCMCGRLDEAEMARALFLTGLPACHPYEWYPRQMQGLEELMLRYETFACVVGPLACVGTALGVCLLLVQLSCCPLLLFGRWGGFNALFLFLATDEEIDRVFEGEGSSPAAEQEVLAELTEAPSRSACGAPMGTVDTAKRIVVAKSTQLRSRIMGKGTSELSTTSVGGANALRTADATCATSDGATAVFAAARTTLK
eukprot:TRINITY_DN25652_c0_g1_i1.p1 TRINITY_DN25652_c0_g1~~TRINITY_DN25652_c0_g1_i1.p1  ORF type:complete len:742 (+),score=109.32 TRINITY_DN25652_c0_g1_i1:153-2378(+)